MEFDLMLYFSDFVSMIYTSAKVNMGKCGKSGHGDTGFN